MNPVFACPLATRGIVGLGGEDRRAFLQGLVSNDIDLCKEERAIHAALLTPQGKFLHDLFIADAGEEFLIDVEAARAEDALKRLAAYKLRAKATLRNAAEEYDVWALWGNGDRRPEVGGRKIYADPRLAELGARAIVKKGTSPGDFARADFEAYDRHRLLLGVADGSRDMLIEKSTLAEGNFDFLNGVSWTKGCYVGQELTARMHYRGLVKKRLFPVRIEGPAPEFGAILKLGAEDAGDMRSASGDLGLALLNVEKAEAAMRENAALACGESKLTVWKPAWMTDGRE